MDNNWTLRPWQKEDAAKIVDLANNPKIAANLRDAFPHPYTAADATDYVNICIEMGDEAQYLRAICVDGEPVGSIGVFLKGDVYRKSAELGYWLGEPYWGSGIVTWAIGALCREVFEKYDVVRIFAEPYATNVGSCRVLEKNGFVREGTLRNSVYKNGALLDSHIYALLK